MKTKRVTGIPLSELSGKSEQGIEDLVVGKVTDTMMAEFDIDLAAEELEAASDEEINAAFARIADADVAGVAAANVAELTKDAWQNISREDLAEATAYAAEFAATLQRPRPSGPTLPIWAPGFWRPGNARQMRPIKR